MLVLESHLRPLLTPVMTEIVAIPMTTTTTMVSRNWSEPSSTQPMKPSPAAICCVPKPREVTTPKTVPVMATMSIRWPTQDSMSLRPKIGSSSQRTDRGRPRRNVI